MHLSPSQKLWTEKTKGVVTFFFQNFDIWRLFRAFLCFSYFSMGQNSSFWPFGPTAQTMQLVTFLLKNSWWGFLKAVDKKNKQFGDKIFWKNLRLTPCKPIFMFQVFFNGQKRLILAVWPYSPNYTSNNIFVIFTVFVNHENIGKELKFTVLSCTF